jgi:hypothetical protein
MITISNKTLISNTTSGLIHCIDFCCLWQGRFLSCTLLPVMPPTMTWMMITQQMRMKALIMQIKTFYLSLLLLECWHQWHSSCLICLTRKGQLLIEKQYCSETNSLLTVLVFLVLAFLLGLILLIQNLTPSILKLHLQYRKVYSIFDIEVKFFDIHIQTATFNIDVQSLVQKVLKEIQCCVKTFNIKGILN